MKHLFSLCVLFLALAGCSSDNDDVTADTRFLYTSTNSPLGNEIVPFLVESDGLLDEMAPVSTGGVGDADEGDFDAQGAMRIVGEYLLVANAGDDEDDPAVIDGNGSISVFRIDPFNGGLERIDQSEDYPGVQNMDSFGKRPVTLGIREINGVYWVVVGNQHSNRVCITPGDATTVRGCLDQFGDPIGELLDTPDDGKRNLHLYRFEDGVLTPVKQLDAFIADYGGPSQVNFSPDGTKLVMTSWGIAHIAYPAMENLQLPSRVYLYDVDVEDGELSLSNRRYYENPGISGSVGFSWSSDSRYVYVSSFALSQAAFTDNLTALDTDNTSTVFTSDNTSEPSGSGDIPSLLRPGACWTWISPGDDRIYVVAFATNTIAYYEVDGAELERDQLIIRTRVPERDTKDIFVTLSGRYAYVLGGIFSHTVTMFDIESDGRLIEKRESPLDVNASRPNGENVSDLVHTYLGIAGYPASYSGF